MTGGGFSLWWLLALREWRHHPWRHGAALLAVTLGVALAYSVHLINSSALSEFSQAVRTANGNPDLTLRGSGFDDVLFERVSKDPAVELASPVLEVDTYALSPDGRRLAVRVLGLDALLAAPLAPDLMPQPGGDENRLAFLDPHLVFANAAAQQALGLVGSTGPARTVTLQTGASLVKLHLAGVVASGGPPLLVMDIAGAQHHFAAQGQLSRLDLRLVPGADTAALQQRLQLPSGVMAVAPEESEQRVSQLSRAYRINLTVLALVALFVGTFLVFSVVSLSVAQRAPALALLGVLGMSAAARHRAVVAECAALGAAGTALGLLAGAGMAAAALRLLAGDLGGGYFPGVTPRLRVAALDTAIFAALGIASAVAGGWWPARQAQRLVPAQALKGLGHTTHGAPAVWPGLLLLTVGAVAATLPPIAGLPLAAYAAVAALLFGGVALVPAVVHGVLAWVPPPKGALALLAVQRARMQRQTATAAVAGVVASLALSVALTVMVASFRTGVSDWLGSVLPADLYARSAGSGATADQAWLPPDFIDKARLLDGVQRVQGSRLRLLRLEPGRPAVALVARPLAQPEQALPMLGAALPPSTLREGETGVYVSEAMVSLYGARQGQTIELPLPLSQALPQPVSQPLSQPLSQALSSGNGETQGRPLQARVLGVWRDYARQFGTVVMADSDYQRLTADTRLNDVALWLKPGADIAAVQTALRALVADASMLEFGSSAELRKLSLRIFDRSFAVTYYLQAVAIVIGLVGIAASLSAQVLARRKEFGLLSHLGLTRGQIVAVVTGEGAAWVAAGVLVGALLGLAISMVLVWVVNPQSFHWTMELVLPWGRLAFLCAAVMLAGTATAAFSARSAAARPAVMSVKEDW
jgi:putative ABC transport system permease protein